MSAKRSIQVASSAVALIAALVSAFGSSDSSSRACAAGEPSAVVTVVAGQESAAPVLEDEDVLVAAANWTWYGCISRSGNCYDVYQDSKGALWVCLACGTTGNPGPGKCRKLTAYEIANALW